jgi:hypothetical protein
VKPQQTYEEWRKTHPPIMGASEAAPAAENGTQPTDQQTTDPWTSTLEGVDEVYRPHVEQAINPLREQFGPRLELADRLEPLSDYADDLLALHGMADEDGTALQDFLGFAQMASQVDPENPDSEANQAFAEWFYEIGDQLGLLDPDDARGRTTPTIPRTATSRTPRSRSCAASSGSSRPASSRPRRHRASRAPAGDHGLIEKAIDDHGLGGSNDEDRQKSKDAILRFANDYKDDASLSNRWSTGRQGLLAASGGLRPSCSAATRTSSESSPEPPRATGCPTRGPRRSPPAIPRSRAAARRPPHCRGWVADPNVNYAIPNKDE